MMRFRLLELLAYASLLIRVQLFADEEAIETYPPRGGPALRRPVGCSYSLMKKRLRRLCTGYFPQSRGQHGCSYSLMKKRLRQTIRPFPAYEDILRVQLFADEEAIETIRA